MKPHLYSRVVVCEHAYRLDVSIYNVLRMHFINIIYVWIVVVDLHKSMNITLYFDFFEP